METSFNTIALIGKPDHQGANQTLVALHHYLNQFNLNIVIERRVGEQLNLDNVELLEMVELGERADLAIVVGGDGNMLGAARVLARYDVAVVGVNRGNLGFLTDLSPDSFEEPLERLLTGDFQTEYRFLLEAQVHRHGQLKASNTAMNEAVLHPGQIAHMIEFEVYINGNFMYSQRADGMIVATPTGSTAYSLSAGGPILTPNLNAMTLVPMFPHTLSCRPIVIDADAQIKLMVAPTNKTDQMLVSCDGHVSLAVQPGDEIHISKSPYKLRLLHPRGHSYFDVLRSKLGWGSKLF
ncbi:NAD(+) kinase [Zobellella aerophila]|uniref:NAD kinase n=1 Tax=Zobellella aerophila TaxID=870480 RepID=A0ABP6VKK5_9GAMM